MKLAKLMQAVFFFVAWGAWWGLFLGMLCGTLIVPLFGTVIAGQVGLVAGVLGGMVWAVLIHFNTRQLSPQIAPSHLTLIRRQWIIGAWLLGSLSAGVAMMSLFLVWFSMGEAEISYLIGGGASFWAGLALADSTTRYIDRKTEQPDPLAQFGAPFSSSYHFFLHRPLVRLVFLVLMGLWVFYQSSTVQSSITFLPHLSVWLFFIYSTWAVSNGTFIGFLNRLIFLEYFAEMPLWLYRRLLMAICFSFNALIVLSFLNNFAFGISLENGLLVLATGLVSAHSAYHYAPLYYGADVPEKAKPKRQTS